MPSFTAATLWPSCPRNMRRDLACRLVVLDHQNASAATGLLLPAHLRAGLVHRFRQVSASRVKQLPRPGSDVTVKLAAQRFREPAGNGEPESGAAIAPRDRHVGLGEGIEDLL